MDDNQVAKMHFAENRDAFLKLVRGEDGVRVLDHVGSQIDESIGVSVAGLHVLRQEHLIH